MKLHHNKWPWGTTETYIAFDGAGIFRLSIMNNEPDVIFLSDVSVQKRHRGKGYARSMLRIAIHRAEQTECKKMRLYAYPGDFVIDWYKRNGFVETGNTQYDGAVEMEKTL